MLFPSPPFPRPDRQSAPAESPNGFVQLGIPDTTRLAFFRFVVSHIGKVQQALHRQLFGFHQQIVHRLETPIVPQLFQRGAAGTPSASGP